MKKTILSTAVASTLFLVGCGSDNNNSTTPETTTQNSTETLTGYFIDAAVANVDYTTSSGLSGTTDRFGRFQYKNGDKVKLSIGNLLLGEVEPTDEGVITPATLSEGDEKQETLLLRTLQTLDADGNTSNGIIIPKSVSNDLKDIEETSIADHNESSLIEIIDHGDKKRLDKDYDGEIDVKESDAKEHFENSQRDWNEGKRPDAGHEDEAVGESNENSHGNGSENGNRSENAQNGSENGHAEENNSTEESGHGNEFDLSKYPMSVLTPEIKNSLTHMGSEERLAYDVYQNLYKYHVTESATEIKQMKNISEKSEVKHIQIVKDLVTKYALTPDDVTNVTNPVTDKSVALEEMPSGVYNVSAVQELYNTLYAEGTESTTKALLVGCKVEVTDIEDLDGFIVQAENSNAKDVVDAFDILRKGSYNHYWAFDKGLKKAGIENGCYVEGDALLTNKEGVYPTNENGSEGEDSSKESESNGNGQGQGNKN